MARWRAIAGTWAMLFSIGATAAPAMEGGALFRESCAHCHGELGMGGSMGPSLLSPQAVALTEAGLVETIRDGRPDKGMPALEYGPDQIAVLVKHVRKLQRDQRTADARLSGEDTAATAGADPATAEGLALFRGAARCAECHSVNEQGGITAPDLTHIADRMTPVQLLDAIQNPSQSIAEGYAASEIVMRDGTTLRGWSRYETADTLQLYDPKEQLWTTYFQKDLLQRHRLTESLMPNGLLDSLTDAQRSKLMAFLGSLKAEAN